MAAIISILPLPPTLAVVETISALPIIKAAKLTVAAANVSPGAIVIE